MRVLALKLCSISRVCGLEAGTVVPMDLMPNGLFPTSAVPRVMLPKEVLAEFPTVHLHQGATTSDSVAPAAAEPLSAFRKTTMSNVPAALGVPVIAPLAAPIEKPGGKP